ncbi:MAG: DOPA 4,5-dioxygenase family protein [Alphaproteobacteria bacterium]
MSQVDIETLMPQARDLWNKNDQLSNVNSYHIHVYFQEKHASEPKAEVLARYIGEKFATDVVSVSRTDAGGPHLQPNWAIKIKTAGFSNIIPWLHINGENSGGLSILVHPQTGNKRSDHLFHSLWLGTPIGINENHYNRPGVASPQLPPSPAPG